MDGTSSTYGELVPMRRKVERRFYEPLLLLSALGQMRGERTKAEIVTDTLDPNIQTLRRNFVDGIAYICSYEKTPKRVTAVAIQKIPQGIVVWLAANKKVGGKVKQFLDSVLSDIQQISTPSDKDKRRKEGERLTEGLASKIVDFNTPRIGVYYRQVAQILKSWKIISEGHKHEGTARSNEFKLAAWLRKNFVTDTTSPSNNKDFQALVRRCYKNRSNLKSDTLERLATQGESPRLEAEELLHLLYKLGKHMHITKSLIEAAVSLSHDFVDGYQVEVLPSSTQKGMPLTPKEATVKSIIGRMFSRPEEQSKFMNRLHFIWDPDEMTQLLHTKRTKKTQVHAEILLIDHFDKNRYSFLDDNDKYVGCSKPACYLCHAYIERHPGRYTVPRSHQKLYVGWRVPDISPQDPASAARHQTQERILRKLIDLVREDITTDIASRTSRLPYHADSTIGRTSTARTLASTPNLLSHTPSLCDVDVEALDINHLDTADSDPSQAPSDMTSASKTPGCMPEILSSAPSSQDVHTGEIDTSRLEATDPEQPLAEFDMPSASQTTTLVPDDISSARVLCDGSISIQRSRTATNSMPSHVPRTALMMMKAEFHCSKDYLLCSFQYNILSTLQRLQRRTMRIIIAKPMVLTQIRSLSADRSTDQLWLQRLPVAETV
ncbi:hypothetical protein BDR22DRAFT_852548 [Usnea florida]